MGIPFNFGKVAGPELFIDRETETLHLTQNIESHINTILISPRRWGKSSLVKHVAAKLQERNKKVRFCFIDLYSIRDEAEFYQYFATGLIKATSNKWEEWAANGKKFFRNLIPRFHLGVDPLTDFTVTFDLQDLKTSADEILNLPEKISKEKKLNIVVCIDEFQNIAHFEEPLVMQKKMRAAWQNHQAATYCLYGSKRHMLANIFENKSMPFYKFGDTLFLRKIDCPHWIDFIIRQFKKTNKVISEEMAGKIAGYMKNHPYFVQMYAASVWKQTNNEVMEKHLNTALEGLFEQYDMMYQREMDSLTNKQLNFLKALTDNVSKFSSIETLTKYKLGSQGNIKRLRHALEEKEIIDLWGKQLQFLDPLFALWFQQTYMNNKR